MSAGLGPFLPDKEKDDLKQRARQFLTSQLPNYEDMQKELHDKYSRWSHRLEETREQLSYTRDASERAEIERHVRELEDRCNRLRDQQCQLHELLQPNLGEAATVLGDYVCNAGNTRYIRIQHEIELLLGRIREGWQCLVDRPDIKLPRWAEDLMQEIETYLAGRPPSPREHGLEEDERQRRQSAEDHWQNEGGAIREKIHEQMAVIENGAADLPNGLGKDLLHWLADAEDYFDFGVTGRGVLAGLTCRRGWRLRHLLRPYHGRWPPLPTGKGGAS